jgi:polysaccharide biosynthesis/export protein
MIMKKLPCRYRRLISCYPFIALLSLLLLASCSTSRKTAYFKNLQSDTTIQGFVSNDYESLIRPGDRLSIIASSLSPAEDAQFNNGAATGGEPEMNGFLVYPEGTVLLHRLGRVTAAGLTRRQLAAKLQAELLPYMKEPIVNVQYLNHKVTVMGSVGGPQVMLMPQEQLNILEVLVKSGDITPEGLKDRVMIIREEGTDKKVKILNLEDANVFKSPWFYVQPNDIVFVPKDEKAIESEEKRRRLQTTLSLVASGLTFIFFVVDRVTR